MSISIGGPRGQWTRPEGNRSGATDRHSWSALAAALVLVTMAFLAAVGTPRVASAYTSHNPILIHGNGDFTAAKGVTGGSGTWDDPFIIEGWEFSLTAVYSIVVYDTDAYVVIRNVYVHVGSSQSYGIQIGNSTNARVSGNRVSGPSFGIIAVSPGIVIADNDISSTASAGISVSGSPGAVVVGNNVTSGNGISFVTSPNITVTSNTVAGNPGGILLSYTDGARVYHNDFIGNTVQAMDLVPPNAWDDGYPSGGNYWSDYAGVDACSGPNQDVCPSPDGIGDTPYVTDGGRVRDRYPLMTSYLDRVPPTVAIDAPADGEVVSTSSIPVGGTASDVGGDGVARVEIRANGGAWQPAFGRTSWSASVGLARGPNVVEARAWDYGGNPSAVASANVSFAPTVTIASPADGAVLSVPTFAVTGTATIATVVRIRIDGGAWEDASGTSVWSEVVGPLADGGHTIQARAFNDTLASGTTSVTIMIAVPAPSLVVLAPTEGESVSGTVVLSGTATPGASILVRVDAGGWAAVATADGNGTWSSPWDTTNLVDGAHGLAFKASMDDRESPVVTRDVTLANAPNAGGWTSGFVLLAGLLVALTVVGVLALLWRRRRRAPPMPAVEATRGGSG